VEGTTFAHALYEKENYNNSALVRLMVWLHNYTILIGCALLRALRRLTEANSLHTQKMIGINQGRG